MTVRRCPSICGPRPRSTMRTVFVAIRFPSNIQELREFEPPDMQEFRARLQDYARASYRQRPSRGQDIIDWIRSSDVPIRYFDEVLRLCSAAGSPDGLDIGTDLVAGLGAQALEYAHLLLAHDARRWTRTPTISLSEHNDHWCMLL